MICIFPVPTGEEQSVALLDAGSLPPLALAAEAVGCMRVLTDATVEYCKTRKQFGQPIGNFQVLQHRMADMFIECEQSLSISYMVNLKLDEGGQERDAIVKRFRQALDDSGMVVPMATKPVL